MTPLELILILFMIFTNISSEAFAGNKEIDEHMHSKQIIDNYQAKHPLNAAIFISKNGKLLLQENRGFADLAVRREFTSDTPFPIASITKQFTAAAILLLKEDGIIDLNKPIINYLIETHPIWQGEIPDWAHKVTPHHLLTHTSGLHDYTYDKWDNLEKVVDSDVIPIVISSLKDKPLAFPIGSKFSYNNTGYLLLSVIIDELSPEKNMSQFLQNRIFSPLKMDSSYLPIISSERSSIANIYSNSDLPMRYTANIDDPKAKLNLISKVEFQAPYLGGAAMISTANDLLKWNNALYNGKILSTESLKLITTPYMDVDTPIVGKVKFSYGLMVRDIADDKIYGHGGWIIGIRTDISYNPNNQITILILSNLSPNEEQTEDIQAAQTKSLLDLGVELHKQVKMDHF